MRKEEEREKVLRSLRLSGPKRDEEKLLEQRNFAAVGRSAERRAERQPEARRLLSAFLEPTKAKGKE